MDSRFRVWLTTTIIFIAGACSSDQNSGWEFNEDVGTDSSHVENDDVSIEVGQTGASSSHESAFDFVEIRSQVRRAECLHVLLSNSNPRDTSTVAVNDGYDVSTIYLEPNECVFDEPLHMSLPNGSIVAMSAVGEVFIAESEGYLDVRLTIILESGEEFHLDKERVPFSIN